MGQEMRAGWNCMRHGYVPHLGPCQHCEREETEKRDAVLEEAMSICDEVEQARADWSVEAVQAIRMCCRAIGALKKDSAA